MKLHYALCAALIGASGAAMAAVSAEEAKQLGTTLTEFGAIKAGNADGTIPAYTGGLTKAPAGYKPDSGFWPDPFKDEKPLFRIDAKNVDKYAAKLSDGQKALIKKNPDTYYIDVYPSHRTAAFPEKILKATVRNATTCSATKDGLAIDRACRGGMPFPIPKTGNEVMWGHILRYMGDTAMVSPDASTWVVDASGKATQTSEQYTYQDYVYYQVDQADRDPDMIWRTYSNNKVPARRAGEMTGLIDFLDPVDKARKAWNYMPGQRRVKLSPEFAYDTPVGSMGGVTLFDELFVFTGKQDRFDFKLIGKKEMYIPYNSYRMYNDCPTVDALQPKHVNPACERWELHRVWVVEATLKPGQRHVYSKRIYYFDEDWSGASLYDAYDQSGELYRALFQGTIQLYGKSVQPYGVKNTIYDFNKGVYAYINDASKSGYFVQAARRSERELNPEAVVARETAR
ncbi:hypothetical protein RN01_28435 [Cupriavidus sp. SHE]|jgi:Protein of unknown function (DUF1329)|uniref:DUF1329 domain-containing protein n=1 Tax=Cupriavidus metallidurans TaxID=119219 RepID=A0A482IWF3_9BURK|nr:MULTISPECIES: DUF1329 domain-containing protein [Cupriavidus]KWR76324.1 hypothetical protein RN01_28435 [Cupriavidus sp. SHE]QBP11787.1 DUF1329 domain-containing protein [Cupriavidus metallidurans]